LTQSVNKDFQLRVLVGYREYLPQEKSRADRKYGIILAEIAKLEKIHKLFAKDIILFQ